MSPSSVLPPPLESSSDEEGDDAMGSPKEVASMLAQPKPKMPKGEKKEDVKQVLTIVLDKGEEEVIKAVTHKHEERATEEVVNASTELKADRNAHKTISESDKRKAAAQNLTEHKQEVVDAHINLDEDAKAVDEMPEGDKQKLAAHSDVQEMMFVAEKEESAAHAMGEVIEAQNEDAVHMPEGAAKQIAAQSLIEHESEVEQMAVAAQKHAEAAAAMNEVVEIQREIEERSKVIAKLPKGKKKKAAMAKQAKRKASLGEKIFIAQRHEMAAVVMEQALQGEKELKQEAQQMGRMRAGSTERHLAEQKMVERQAEVQEMTAVARLCEQTAVSKTEELEAREVGKWCTNRGHRSERRRIEHPTVGDSGEGGM